ncbi:interleukin-9 receptor-like isoform X3 [Choloepus didactylus]|uniref:interleukin-9 receptor-like isoform X3 n=1 Tax=Choloepus didactylus TaxID=27675 RepID=UPI00189EB5E4|nr:interleukin-9 receptor-like isoform X3 [Choloepus didactylus]
MGPSRRIREGWTSEGSWLLACTCVCWGAPGLEDGGATRCRAASTGVSSEPVRAASSSHLRRCSCRPTASPSLFTTTSPGRSRSAWWTPSTCPGDMSNVSSDSCVLTWSISPALEPMRTLLAYELAVRRQGQAWEWAQHKGHIVGVTWLRLEAAELDPGSTYEARLRVQMAAQDDGVAEEERYEGQWSEWSQPARFPSPRRRGPLTPPWGRPGSSLVALSIFLLLTSLTYLLFKLTPRVKRTLGQGVPSPAAFFQPLYSVHHGNFQIWAGVHRAGLQLSREGDGPLPGAPESGFGEAISPLTYIIYSPLGREEGEGTGHGLSEDKLPAGSGEQGAQTPAYLPQEDWAIVSPVRPTPPDPEGGSSSDYCALGCDGGCPLSALAWSLSWERRSPDAQPGARSCAGTGKSQRQTAGLGLQVLEP